MRMIDNSLKMENICLVESCCKEITQPLVKQLVQFLHFVHNHLLKIRLL